MKSKIALIFIIVISFGLGMFVGISFFAGNSSGNSLKGDGNAREYSFSGEGRENVLGPIVLDEGLVIVRAKNQTGPNNIFTVSVSEDENGDGVLSEGEGWTGVGISVGYKEAEAFDGTIAFKAAAPQYFIHVSGGRWEIAVTQPKKLSGNAPRFSRVQGRGYAVTDKFFLPEGEHTFRATHNGGGNFIIYRVDENGNFTSRLVNEIGETDTEFTTRAVFAGNYVFAVRADGNWTIERVE